MNKNDWSMETMLLINKLTPDIKGKVFDPDWFALRQRLESYEEEFNRMKELLNSIEST